LRKVREKTQPRTKPIRNGSVSAVSVEKKNEWEREEEGGRGKDPSLIHKQYTRSKGRKEWGRKGKRVGSQTFRKITGKRKGEGLGRVAETRKGGQKKQDQLYSAIWSPIGRVNRKLKVVIPKGGGWGNRRKKAELF